MINDAMSKCLTELPDLIHAEQQTVNSKRYELDRYRLMKDSKEAEIAIEAFTAALFDDGKGGKRAAKNEEERKVAVMLMHAQNKRLMFLARKVLKLECDLRCAEADLELQRNRQTNTRDAVRYVTAEKSVAARY